MQAYIDVLAEAAVAPGQAAEHLLGPTAAIQEEVQPDQRRLDDGARNQLSDRTDLQQPVSANLLRRLGDVGPFQILDRDLVYSFFRVVREAQALDPLED